MAIRRKSKQPTVSIVIPVYNEVATIIDLLKVVKASKVSAKEIIVVDDGSDDGTRELLHHHRSLIDNLVVKEKNEGKGATLKAGFNQATGELIIIQDADLEYDPRDYERLIGPIREGRADVVYGSRFVGSSPHRVVYFTHYIANMLLTFISNVFTNLNLTDMETGYKAFRRDLIKDLRIEERGFGIEPEITARLAARQAKFYEVGISYYGRTYEEGKKIGFKDFLRALWVIIKYGISLRILPYLSYHFWL